MSRGTKGRFRSRKSGFSLIELILAALIMAIVGGFGLFSLARGHDSAQSKGLAEEIAEELKAARQQAISKQIPVALAFPSSGGAVGRSQVFYQIEGLARPIVTRSGNYSSSYPDSCFFWGRWGNGAPESTAPNPALKKFDLSKWSPLPAPKDYILVFSPSGSVQSNGLPLYDGEYRLLTSNGVTGGDGLGTPSAVSKPYTVRISKTGSVIVEPGVRGGVGISVSPSLPLGTVANSVPSVAGPQGTPKIVRLRSEPRPEENSEGGAEAVIPEEGYITLIAEASDPSGKPLSMRWRAEGPKGEGSFSSQDPLNMSWDQTTQTWAARVMWTPPADAEGGDIYSLTCYVKNPDGQEVQEKLYATKSLEVVTTDKIANVSTDGNWETFYLAWMNPEGTNVFNVTVPKPGNFTTFDMLTPVWAPNGDKIAFYAWEDKGGGRIVAIFYMVNEDGTNLQQIFRTDGDLNDYFFGPSFSPNGARVTFSAYEEPNNPYSSRVRVSDTFGANPNLMRCTGAPGDPDTETDHIDVTWHPTQDYILYTATVYWKDTFKVKDSSLRICDVSDLSNPPSTTTNRYIIKVHEDSPGAGVQAGAIVGESHWSHDGKKIVYVKGERMTGNKLYVLGFNPATGWATNPDGSDIRYPGLSGPSSAPNPPSQGFYPGKDITPSGVNSAFIPRFSPDNNKIAFLDDGTNSGKWKLWVVNANGSNARKLTDKDVWGYNWSPDGKKIAFTTFAGEKMFVVDVDGGTPKDVTPPGFQAWTTPSWWSPKRPNP